MFTGEYAIHKQMGMRKVFLHAGLNNKKTINRQIYKNTISYYLNINTNAGFVYYHFFTVFFA
jgi:endonuclease IV